MTAMQRLVSFVGTGDYQPASYVWGEHPAVETPYVAEALARRWNPTQIVLLATEAAEEKHRAALDERLCALEPVPHIDWRRLLDGRTQEEQWAEFACVQTALTGAQEHAALLLDITHGFRAQPFLAGAALLLVRAAGRLPRETRVVYGEFCGPAPEPSHIWDLGQFLELGLWAEALSTFLRTGSAGPVVDLARQAQHRAQDRIRRAGTREFPRIGGLITALEQFSDDLATVRLAAVISGYEQDPAKKERAVGSAQRLLDAIDQHREEAGRHSPPVALILDRLTDWLRPLAAGTLNGIHGQEALHALARLYQELERWPEAAIVLREGRVNRHARNAQAIEVNSTDFDDEARRQADADFGANDPAAREITDVRNDIEHGGMRKQPLSAGALKKRIGHLIDRYASQDEAQASVEPPVPRRRIFVSRHPGAKAWADRKGIQVDEQVAHLDLDTLQPGDTVIGTLPVNLAAKVCEKGVRYVHLSLDLPAEARGRELTADELDKYHARLEVFSIRAVQTY